MIRILSLDVIALAFVLSLLYVIYRSYMNQREQKSLKHVVYFSGGPLHGSQRRLAKLPPDIYHAYDKPRLVLLGEGKKPEPVETWYDAHYEHQGQGVYEYKGSIIRTDQAHYDVPDDL